MSKTDSCSSHLKKPRFTIKSLTNNEPNGNTLNEHMPLYIYFKPFPIHLVGMDTLSWVSARLHNKSKRTRVALYAAQAIRPHAPKDSLGYGLQWRLQSRKCPAEAGGNWDRSWRKAFCNPSHAKPEVDNNREKLRSDAPGSQKKWQVKFLHQTSATTKDISAPLSDHQPTFQFRANLDHRINTNRFKRDGSQMQLISIQMCRNQWARKKHNIAIWRRPWEI